MDKSIVSINQIAARSSTCYEFSNSNQAEVVEIEDDDTSVGTVEKQIENLKLNYQFNEKDVPEIFKTLIKDRMNDLKKVGLKLENVSSSLKFDDFKIRFEKTTDNWKVTYEQINTTIETVNPEKSIVDHLWFVLKNPRIKLKFFGTMDCRDLKQVLNSEKLTTLLQSMIDSINHQLHTNVLDCEGFNEDTFLSMLKHVKPGTLEKICFDISWKEERNYQKMKEIVETDQWKQAKTIYSHGVAPLKIDDLFQYKVFSLQLDSVTPEDVLRVVEHAFNSSYTKCCILCCKHKYDIDAIIDFLRSQNDESRITKAKPTNPNASFGYAIIKFGKLVQLVGNENYIVIGNY